jgi:hypothetical protein
VYVDITKGLLKPRVIEKEGRSRIEGTFHICLEEIEKELSSLVAEEKSIPVIRHCCNGHNGDGCGTGQNLSSLFGQLLGYPVVYWFDTSKGYDLDMVKLVQHSVQARTERASSAMKTQVLAARLLNFSTIKF